MKKTLLLAILLLPGSWVFAAGGGKEHLDPVNINMTDKASLRRGATLFVNFCLSCHSAAYMRYNRMAKDLEIPESVVQEKMLFAGDKIADLMKTTMPVADAKEWFGIAPPDLSLVARVRDPDWIYTYLRSLYLDQKSSSGWSNTLFPNVAMPHILYELEGSKELVGLDPKTKTPKFKLIKAGKMTTEQFDGAMRDLTNFLVYLAEPIKLKRYSLGAFVLAFLLLLLVASYALKKEYWRDVH